MRLILMVFFLFFFFEVIAQDSGQTNRLAEAYYEAKDYDKAIELWRELHDQSLFSWQRARLHNNIGTALLAAEKWDEAIEEFSMVPYRPHSAPLLSRALKANLAILQYQEALELHNREEISLDDFSKGIFLYRETLRNLKEASRANCLLNQKIGIADCKEGQSVRDLRNRVKGELAMMVREYGEARISESTTKAGVPFLLSGVKLVISHLDFLKRISLNDKLQKEYLKLFIKDAESWFPLWDAQTEQMDELDQAYVQYREGISLLENNRFEKSRIAFLSSSAILSEIMQKLWGDDALMELVRQLLTSYIRVLDQLPIQFSSLTQLQSEQQQMNSLIESEKEEFFPLQMSNQALSQSLTFASQAKGPPARFFLEEARQWLQRFLDQKTSLTPETILEIAIREQSHALTLNRMSQDIESEIPEVQETITQSQAKALDRVSPFISAVIEQEIREFPTRCQCHPWGKVIPLFDQGKQSAVLANEILEGELQNIIAMPKQEEAVKYWKKALEYLRHPEEKSKPEKQQPEEEAPAQPEEMVPIQEVLRYLQNMDRDDQSLQPQEKLPQKGVRPW